MAPFINRDLQLSNAASYQSFSQVLISFEFPTKINPSWRFEKQLIATLPG